MNPNHTRLGLAVGLLGAAALPVHADSLVSSAASGSSASVGSISNSLGRSSDSSRGDRVAAGDYRVVEIALAADRPAMARLRLQPLAAGDEIELYVPQATLAAAAIEAGQVVGARLRSYGIEFVDGRTRQPFFLVLHDERYRELQSRVVAL